MKVIIAGSRTIQSYTLVEEVIFASGFSITEVVSGYARGVDTVGEAWSLINGLGYAKPFPANWDRFGNAAGHVRNLEMSEYADALISVWDGKSRGTRDMINIMVDRNKPVYVHQLGQSGFLFT